MTAEDDGPAVKRLLGLADGHVVEGVLGADGVVHSLGDGSPRGRRQVGVEGLPRRLPGVRERVSDPAAASLQGGGHCRGHGWQGWVLVGSTTIDYRPGDEDSTVPPGHMPELDRR